MRAHHPFGALLVLVLAACGGSGSTPQSDPGDGDPLGDWQLVAGTVNGQEVPILDDHRITLTLEGSRIGGTAACNGYGGTLRVEGGRLRIEDLAQTAMACVDEAAMTAEAIYMSGLANVESIGLDGDELLVQGPGVELRFVELAPPPTADLVDTVWALETLVMGEVASSVVGEPAILELRSDGTIHGSTGCRAFDGTWVAQGDEIITPTLVTTDEACPPELQAADSHVLAVVGDGFRPSVDGGQLTLSNSGGAGLVYRAAE
ncbi:MAG: META domain-containing protein [Candidatus Limnocylindria bacterium]